MTKPLPFRFDPADLTLDTLDFARFAPGRAAPDDPRTQGAAAASMAAPEDARFMEALGDTPLADIPASASGDVVARPIVAPASTPTQDVVAGGHAASFEARPAAEPLPVEASAAARPPSPRRWPAALSPPALRSA